jgi:ferredoxin
MTISVTDYFATRKDDRKKETRYLNVINKDSCTSCQSCATVCPVDCIFEVVSPIPGQSYHQIDTSRCIGCQMCYRSPSDSDEHYTLTVCPWNAIDMLHNPNVKPDDASILRPYWRGDAAADLPWSKLEEYGYQLRLDGEVFVPTNRPDLLEILSWYGRPDWLYSEDGDTVAIATEISRDDEKVRFSATEGGWALLDCIFDEWHRVWMD